MMSVIRLAALDSWANSIGLTPPCSCETCPQAFHSTAWMPASLPDSLRLSLLHPHSASGLTHRTISSPDSQPGSVRSQSNMFPAWRRRGMRTEGAAVAPPRTVIIAGQVGQVWVSCWILLSATCILSAWAQGKNRDFFFFLMWFTCSCCG